MGDVTQRPQDDVVAGGVNKGQLSTWEAAAKLLSGGGGKDDPIAVNDRLAAFGKMMGLKPAMLDAFIQEFVKADVAGPNGKGGPDGVLQSKEQVALFMKFMKTGIENGSLAKQFAELGIKQEDMIAKLDTLIGDPEQLAKVAGSLGDTLKFAAALTGRSGSLSAKLDTVPNNTGVKGKAGTGITFDPIEAGDLASALGDLKRVIIEGAKKPVVQQGVGGML